MSDNSVEIIQRQIEKMLWPKGKEEPVSIPRNRKWSLPGMLNFPVQITTTPLAAMVAAIMAGITMSLTPTTVVPGAAKRLPDSEDITISEHLKARGDLATTGLWDTSFIEVTGVITLGGLVDEENRKAQERSNQE